MKIIKILLIFIINILIIKYVICQSDDMVVIKNNKFYKGSGEFYPIVLNYGISVGHKFGTDNLFLAPYHGYGFNVYFECDDPPIENCHAFLKDDFDKVKTAGFNTLRIVGLGYGCKKDWESGLWTEWPAIKSITGIANPWESKFYEIEEDYDKLFSLFEVLLTLAKEAELKVIIHTKGNKGEYDLDEFYVLYSNYLNALSEHFKDNSTILAFDLFNEPKFHDNHQYTKDKTCDLIESWCSVIRHKSPYRLLTIGLSDSRDVYEWDPHCLDVDFISFHPYPVNDSDAVSTYAVDLHTKKVKREIKWFSKVIKKPWIIGETGFSAGMCNNEPCTICHGDLEEQKDFVENTLNYCYYCGGLGYSWWWVREEMYCNCTSVYNHFYGIFDYQQNPKLAVEPIQDFINIPPNGICDSLDYYYDFRLQPLPYQHYKLSGNITNIDTNEPIENAVIEGHCEIGGEVYYSTPAFSDQSGNFILRSEEKLCQIFGSAEGASQFKDDNIYNNYHGYIADCQIKLKKINMNDDLSLQGLINIGENEDYRAWDLITVADFVIDGNGVTGGRCYLNAGTKIHLKNGFSVKKGAYFHAKVGAVNYKCDDLIDLKSEVTYSDRNSDVKINNHLKSNTHYYNLKSNDINLLIYPNPNSGSFNISYTNIKGHIEVLIFNSLQELIYKNKFNSNPIIIELNNEPKGIYSIILRYNKNIVTTKLIII